MNEKILDKKLKLLMCDLVGILVDNSVNEATYEKRYEDLLELVEKIFTVLFEIKDQMASNDLTFEVVKGMKCTEPQHPC